MDVRAGLVFLLALTAAWACAARELDEVSSQRMLVSVISDSAARIKDREQQKGIQASEEVAANKNQVCTLCEEFATEALDYLAKNKTQSEVIEILHLTCGRVPAFKQQCITLVDYYAPLFFLEVSSVQPEEFCRKVNLCQEIAIIASRIQQDSCEICQQAVSEVLVKLKDPDTQLEIIEVLLKACKSVDNYVQKCKKLVFEYGPLILANAEQFLESTDVCTMLHACSLSPASISEEFTGGKADS